MPISFFYLCFLSILMAGACNKSPSPKGTPGKRSTRAESPLNHLKKQLNNALKSQHKLMAQSRKTGVPNAEAIIRLMPKAMPGWRNHPLILTPIKEIQGLRLDSGYQRDKAILKFSLYVSEINHGLNSVIEAIARFKIESTEGFLRALNSECLKRVNSTNARGIEIFEKKHKSGRLLVKAGHGLILIASGTSISTMQPLYEILHMMDWEKLRSILPPMKRLRMIKTRQVGQG